MDFKNFFTKLAEEKIVLDHKQKENFLFLLNFLKEENKKNNLTAITDDEEIIEKHFYDSLTPFFYLKKREGLALDVGTWAGFPAIPIKFVFPNFKITALDSVTKKINFINKVKNKLNIKDLKTSNKRAEIFSNDLINKEKFDYIFSRATAKTSIVMEVAIQSLKVGGLFIIWKSKNAKKEIEEANNAAKLLGLKLVNIQELYLPVSKAKRVNLFYKKISKTKNIYPRNFKYIKKKPL